MSFTDEEIQGFKLIVKELASDLNPHELISFIKQAIQERERVKFIFTKNLSLALDHIKLWTESIGISREDSSYLNYADILECRVHSISRQVLRNRISSRKSEYQITKAVELPSVIIDKSDFYSFERHPSLPNYISIKSVTGKLVELDSKNNNSLKGMIVLIPQADPGYDWLFGQEIAGLITQYGGANSHMAIRSAEIGLPAAIGVGDKLYESLLNTKVIELDCLGSIIRVIE